MVYCNDLKYNFSRGFKIMLAIALLLVCMAASAQRVTSAVQVGTVQVQDPEGGEITISGRTYGYDYELIKIFLDGEEVEPPILNIGMVVRYTLNASGTVIRLEIIGPADKLENLKDV